MFSEHIICCLWNSYNICMICSQVRLPFGSVAKDIVRQLFQSFFNLKLANLTNHLGKIKAMSKVNFANWNMENLHTLENCKLLTGWISVATLAFHTCSCSQGDRPRPCLSDPPSLGCLLPLVHLSGSRLCRLPALYLSDVSGLALVLPRVKSRNKWLYFQIQRSMDAAIGFPNS